MHVGKFFGLPKIELHCHLDGCVRLETARQIAVLRNVPLPPSIEDALIAPPVCEDLADYIRRIDFALSVMQKEEDLARIAEELVETWAADGVVYGEARFAPQLHRRNGLTLQQVLDAVHAGLSSGKRRHGVDFGLIVCCLRHETEEQSLELAQLSVDNMDKICALDLAGDEQRFDARAHQKAFTLARDAGLHRTAHAGEAAGPGSVREALDLLGAERIGHGARVAESAPLAQEMAERQIALDMCPTSNVQTRCVPSLRAHPITRLLAQGVRVTVSTDARTTSNTSVSAEFEVLSRELGWNQAEFLACQKNAVNAAFISHAERRTLARKLNLDAVSSA
ncbi:MAG: adenosine deaminase [Terriglobales bacterium]